MRGNLVNLSISLVEPFCASKWCSSKCNLIFLMYLSETAAISLTDLVQRWRFLGEGYTNAMPVILQCFGVVIVVPPLCSIFWLKKVLMPLPPLLLACIHTEIVEGIIHPIQQALWIFQCPPFFPCNLPYLHQFTCQQEFLSAFIASTQYTSWTAEDNSDGRKGISSR